MASLVFPYGYGASVAESAVRSRLRRVKDCAAMAAPFHVAITAAAPDRGDFPAGIGVGVALGATRWRHDHPDELKCALTWLEAVEQAAHPIRRRPGW
jgi:hypothetical protein